MQSGGRRRGEPLTGAKRETQDPKLVKEATASFSVVAATVMTLGELAGE